MKKYFIFILVAIVTLILVILIYKVPSESDKASVHVVNGTRRVFDNKGNLLLERITSEEKYSVLFYNDYNVNIEDREILFEVKINDPQDKSFEDFTADPHFSLYKYVKGEWRSIKYAGGVDLYGISANENMIIKFSKPFSQFKYRFKSGLYRVEAEISNGDRDDNGEPIDTIVMGEFNLN